MRTWIPCGQYMDVACFLPPKSYHRRPQTLDRRTSATPTKPLEGISIADAAAQTGRQMF